MVSGSPASKTDRGFGCVFASELGSGDSGSIAIVCGHGFPLVLKVKLTDEKSTSELH